MLAISILIDGGERGVRHPLPPIVQENVKSFARFHASLPHKVFYDEDIIEILDKEFSPEVQQAFNSLQPYAYKADLAKYCLLYHFGGAYADLSYLLVNPLPSAGDKLVVFRDFLWSAPWDTSVGLIYSPPRHKSMAAAIDMVCRNVDKKYYGVSTLCPTGPALFGKALAATLEAEDLISGSALLVPRDRLRALLPKVSLPEAENVHCLAFGNKLVAIKRKRMGARGLGDLGVTTGNAYHDLWEKREVYRNQC